MDYMIGDRVKIIRAKEWFPDKEKYMNQEFVVERIEAKCDNARCEEKRRYLCPKANEDKCIFIAPLEQGSIAGLWTCHCIIEKIADYNIVVNHPSDTIDMVKILAEMKEMSDKGYILDHYEVLGNNESINIEYRLIEV